jgi:hypothetical protein
MQLESQLVDASVGLALFGDVRSRPTPAQGWIQRQPAARAIARAMESQLPADLTPKQRFAALRDIPEAADLEARRQEWAVGQIPESYQHRLPFIHAHTVLFALDAIGKALGRLVGVDGIPAGVVAAREGYKTALPHLVDVRDSAHHVEDRARGLDRRGQSLDLQPVNNSAFNAPNGILGLSNLNGNQLGYTASDGHYREVDISATSVRAAQTAIQGVLDALSWRGPARTVPT